MPGGLAEVDAVHNRGALGSACLLPWCAMVADAVIDTEVMQDHAGHDHALVVGKGRVQRLLQHAPLPDELPECTLDGDARVALPEVEGTFVRRKVVPGVRRLNLLCCCSEGVVAGNVEVPVRTHSISSIGSHNAAYQSSLPSSMALEHISDCCVVIVVPRY